MDNNKYLYKKIDKIQIDGVALKSANKDDICDFLVKGFISSKDKKFSTYANDIVSLIGLPDADRVLNSFLVIIKPDDTGYLYLDIPISVECILTRSISAGDLIYEHDIADITKISFKDQDIDLNPKLGDKIIWLFREKWQFGLFFDYSKQNSTEKIQEELASHYKQIVYSNKYDLLSNTVLFSEIIKDGWFPFISLPSELFSQLSTYYKEDKKFHFHIEKILNHFESTEITKITNRWWKNSVLQAKKEIIQSGIEAYLTNTQFGFINCIKNLSSEFEGIIRYSLFLKTEKREPSTNELKNYLISEGKIQFNSSASLGFPNEFMTYLNDSIFTKFDIQSNITSSRHSINHGVATSEIYSKERALQFILAIDQAVFFLGYK